MAGRQSGSRVVSLRQPVRFFVASQEELFVSTEQHGSRVVALGLPGRYFVASQEELILFSFQQSLGGPRWEVQRCARSRCSAAGSRSRSLAEQFGSRVARLASARVTVPFRIGAQRR